MTSACPSLSWQENKEAALRPLLHLGRTRCTWNRRLAALESAPTHLRAAGDERVAPREPTLPLNSHKTVQLRSIKPRMTSAGTFYILINGGRRPYMGINRRF